MKHIFCRHLRTKALYIDATPEEAFAEREGEEASQCHFWCNLTQTVVGLDDRPAHKNVCKPGRACFEE